MYYRSNEPVFQLEEREIETSTISKEGSEDVEIIQEVEGMEEQEMERRNKKEFIHYEL